MYSFLLLLSLWKHGQLSQWPVIQTRGESWLLIKTVACWPEWSCWHSPLFNRTSWPHTLPHWTGTRQVPSDHLKWANRLNTYWSNSCWVTYDLSSQWLDRAMEFPYPYTQLNAFHSQWPLATESGENASSITIAIRWLVVGWGGVRWLESAGGECEIWCCLGDLSYFHKETWQET